MMLAAVAVHGFTAPQVTQPAVVRSRTSTIAAAHWMDFLKFGGSTPPFDVLEKTQGTARTRTLVFAAFVRKISVRLPAANSVRCCDR